MSNFTPRAIQVLAMARQEVDRLQSSCVGAEHLLLGLIKLGQGPAVTVLLRLGLDLEAVRNAIESHVRTSPESIASEGAPFTREAKRVLAIAGEEAKDLNHSYLGTEHLLLGLLREGENAAARALKSFGVELERTRAEILREVGTGSA
jgi:ATP-dependent Clp protease ATP-binding subunit ClpC